MKNKINVIFTGLIRTEDRFKKSIDDLINLKNKGFIDQIILSTWTTELDNYKGLKSYLTENNIKIVESTPPSQCKGSFLHQSKSLHCGLDIIEDKSLMIFKTRADLYIKSDALVKIMSLDLTIDKNNPNVFEKRVWVPWFEISKPFYLADECFFASYNDMKKLINYDMIYDSYYNIDAGISHIRRFIDPFIDVFPEFEYYLKYLAMTGHGTIKRFEVADYLLESEIYNKFINLYYLIMKEYFSIGLNTDNYIIFREWSNYKQNLSVNNIENAIQKKYSFDESKGQIFDYDTNWISGIVRNKTLKEFESLAIDENELFDLHEKIKKILKEHEKINISFINKVKRKVKSVIRTK